MDTLTHSEQINEIAAALAKAQAEIEGASKSSINPHFRSKYADLASVWDAVRAPLSKHGLAVVQSPCSDGARFGLETMLVHSSGQWFRGVLTVTGKDDGPQTAGSCITYLRRYALQSFAGVAPEDDDANAATRGNGKPAIPVQLPPEPKPDGYDNWLHDLEIVAEQGTPKLLEVWKASKQERRDYIMSVAPQLWLKIKEKAEKVVPAQPRAAPQQPPLMPKGVA